ncbi:hypothetical protein F4X86_04070 [Candidatus Saccharibacteria bacterium]|nr:hypothetical protein [Candidatus Saccharibacteria bacterium]
MALEQRVIQSKQNGIKFKKWLIGAVLAVAGSALIIWAAWAGLAGSNDDRIAGVKDLEVLSFDCQGSFTQDIYYEATCEIDDHSSLYYRLTDDSSLADHFDDDEPYEGGFGSGGGDFGSIFEPLEYPWIWHDADSEETLIHAGTRQIIQGSAFAGGYDAGGTVYEFATGPAGPDVIWSDLEPAGSIPDIGKILEAGAEGGIGGAGESWAYIGPLPNTVTCDAAAIEALGLDDSAQPAAYIRREDHANGRPRAVIAIYPAYYEDFEASTYCIRVAYASDAEETQTAWIKATVPFAEFWQQLEGSLEEESDWEEESEDVGPTEIPPEEPSGDDEFFEEESPEPKKLVLKVETFKDERTRDAYYIGRVNSHPCSSLTSDGFIIDGGLFFVYLDTAATDESVTMTEAGFSYLADRLQGRADDLLPSPFDDLRSGDVVGVEDEEEVEDRTGEREIEVVVMNYEDCRQEITDLLKEASECALSGSRRGRCSGGVDLELLTTIRSVAADCQAMYDKARAADAEPAPSDLADCLQLTEAARQNFIDHIQIVGPADAGYGQLLSYAGYYRFDTELPYVLWDEATESEIGDVRYQFELVALHEYMHQVYHQDLTLKEKIRLHQETLALMENDRRSFFDYLGYSTLEEETRHRISRHGSATFGLLSAKDIVEDINAVREEILAELPESVKEEYGEFINDRHGLPAFIYAVAEVQIAKDLGILYSGAREDNLLQGVDDFIDGNHLERIISAYREGLSEEEARANAITRHLQLDAVARIPVDIRYDGDSSFFGFNAEDSGGDILSELAERRVAFNDMSLENRQLIEEFLNEELQTKLDAALERQNRYHRRSTAMFVEYVKRVFLTQIIMVDLGLGSSQASGAGLNVWLADLDNVSVDSFVTDIKAILDDLDDDQLNALDEELAEARTFEPSLADIWFDDDESSLRIELAEKTLQTAQLHNGIDEGLLGMSVVMSGFFAESYPIVALETPVDLPSWLERHYDRYFDREAVARYFKYHPALRL